MAWPTRSSKSHRRLTWWSSVLMALVAAAVVGGAIGIFWPSTYSATSSFFVSNRAAVLSSLSQPPQGAATSDVSEALRPSQERLSAILSSRLMRSRLAIQYKLAQILGLDETEAEDALSRMAQIAPIGTEGFTIEVTCKGYTVVRRWLFPAMSKPQARQMCADLANSYLQELQDYVTTTSVSEAAKRKHFIEGSLAQVRAQLGHTERRIRQIQDEYQLIDPASKATQVSDRINTLLQSQAQDLATEKATDESLHQARGQLGHVDSMTVASVVEGRNPVIAQLEQKLAQLRVNLATEEASGKTPLNQDVVQIQTSIDSTQKQLSQVREQVRQQVTQQTNPTYSKLVGDVVDLEVTLAGARARSAEDRALLAEAQASLRQLPPVAQEYAGLKQDEDVQMRTLATLKQSLTIADIEEQQSKQAGEFLVLDRAVPPPELTGPPVWLAGGLVLALLLIVAGLMAINRLIFGA